MKSLLYMKLTDLFLLACLVTCAYLMSGCSSASTKVTPEAKVVASSNVYKKSVRTLPMVEVKSEPCSKAYSQVKSHWDWRLAVEVADSCIRGKNFARVDEIGSELSTREPAGPWGPYFLASAARERGELERALWMSELALKRAPEMGVIYYLRAQILWDKKEYGAALSGFEKSIEYDPSIIAAHIFLGQIYFRDQDYSMASKHFYSVLKIEPRHAVALQGLAESQLRESNPQGALDAYSRLADAYPKDGQYLSRMGEIYETVLNDPSSALSVYRKLRDQVKSGRVQKNMDEQLDVKIKDLELGTQKKRSVASTDEKPSGVQ